METNSKKRRELISTGVFYIVLSWVPTIVIGLFIWPWLMSNMIALGMCLVSIIPIQIFGELVLTARILSLTARVVNGRTYHLDAQLFELSLLACLLWMVFGLIVGVSLIVKGVRLIVTIYDDALIGITPDIFDWE